MKSIAVVDVGYLFSLIDGAGEVIVVTIQLALLTLHTDSCIEANGIHHTSLELW